MIFFRCDNENVQTDLTTFITSDWDNISKWTTIYVPLYKKKIVWS